MIEDTSGGLTEECTNVVFKVTDIPKKGYYPNEGPPYYAFEFTAKIDGELIQHKERVAIWLCGPFFKALGCAEPKPGKFDVDPGMLLHKKIIGSIKHETAEKGKSAGKTFARMYDIKPYVPKQESAPIEADEEIPF